jgi:hypothetical protein
VRITHPFHPLFGQEFERVSERSNRHGDRVWYEQDDGSVASIAKAWTDLAAQDPFTVLAEGRVHLHLDSLLQLADLVAAMRDGESPQGGQDV